MHFSLNYFRTFGFYLARLGRFVIICLIYSWYNRYSRGFLSQRPLKSKAKCNSNALKRLKKANTHANTRMGTHQKTRSTQWKPFIYKIDFLLNRRLNKCSTKAVLPLLISTIPNIICGLQSDQKNKYSFSHDWMFIPSREINYLSVNNQFPAILLSYSVCLARDNINTRYCCLFKMYADFAFSLRSIARPVIQSTIMHKQAYAVL